MCPSVLLLLREVDCGHLRQWCDFEGPDFVILPKQKIRPPRFLWPQGTWTLIAVSQPVIHCHFCNQHWWLSSWERTEGREGLSGWVGLGGVKIEHLSRTPQAPELFFFTHLEVSLLGWLENRPLHFLHGPLCNTSRHVLPIPSKQADKSLWLNEFEKYCLLCFPFLSWHCPGLY